MILDLDLLEKSWEVSRSFTAHAASSGRFCRRWTSGGHDSPPWGDDWRW